MTERVDPATARRNVLESLISRGKNSVNGLDKVLPHQKNTIYVAVKQLQRNGLVEKYGGKFRATDEGKALVKRKAG